MLDRGKEAKPLYLQIKEIIKHKITHNEYRVGMTIPSENDLEEMFGVSRMTIRQAVSELVNEGMLRKERGRGRGTIVLTNAIADNLSTIKSFTQKMNEEGHILQNKNVEVQVMPADENTSSALALGEGEGVLRLKRTRMVNQDIIMYSISYLPESLNLPADPAVYGSLYQQLDAAGVKVVRAEECIEATLADDVISSALSVPPLAAVLKRTRTGYGENGRPLEYTTTYYRSDKYKYIVELTS